MMSTQESFYIGIAGLTVEMRCRYGYSYDYCRDYVTDRTTTPDIIAATDFSELERESLVYGGGHSLGYCECICLYRAIAEVLPSFDAFVFHGAAVDIEGKAFIFAAPSGTGKSTHVSLLMKNYPEQVRIINGDKPIIRKLGGKFYVYSTPWAGKEGWQENISAPLGGICLLSRGECNEMSILAPQQAFERIAGQIYIPKNGNAMLKSLDLLDKLGGSVRFYKLECNTLDEAADVSFARLKADI